jgi:hypothetical protein
MWSTQVYLGVPGEDPDYKMYCRVVYRKHMKKQNVYAAHAELSSLLNKMGEDGYTLPEAASTIFDDWLRYGVIRPLFLKTCLSK